MDVRDLEWAGTAALAAGVLVVALAPWARRRAGGAAIPLVRWAAASAVSAAAVVSTTPDLRAVCLTWMVVSLTLLSAVDIETRMLPNRMLYPLGAVGAVLVVAVAAVRQQPGEVWGALAGLVLGAAPLWAVWWMAPPAALGFGDVRLMGLIGLQLGVLSPTVVLVAILVGAGAGVVAGGAAVVTGRRSRRDPFPFGPWLALGAVVAAATAGI
jgi:leader peptidase (prepilin peptidase) / N-methyltransferase